MPMKLTNCICGEEHVAKSTPFYNYKHFMVPKQGPTIPASALGHVKFVKPLTTIVYYGMDWAEYQGNNNRW